MVKPALLAVLALLALPLAAPVADACGVPCGRIYPTILIQVGDGSGGGPKVFDAKVGEPLVVEATLTYRFDMQNDGYTVAAPNEPVRVSFEFPRKPAWVEMKVEPESLEVPVNDPRFIQATPDASAPQVHFVWSTPIKVTATVTGQAILRDGYDYAKLLVFAKSTESGLYQAGYGIKEVRIAPEGALHESDVASTRDVFTAAPLPALDAIGSVEASFGGTTATLTPPDGLKFWSPATWTVGLDPAPKGRAFLALHDEAGNLVATHGPVPAAPTLSFNATLARPGHHAVTVTLLPDAGTATPPMTFALPFQAGDASAEGHVYEKLYLVHTNGLVPAPTGNANDATAQWERDVPFFAFDNAQSVNVLVTLDTPGLPVPLGRGAANVQFMVLDPDGNLLGQNSADAVNPQKPHRLGSVPQEGWYVLRLRGVGAPVGTTWDARVEVAYPAPPQARNRADGVPDDTGGMLRVAGRNLTLPVDELGVWQPGSLQPALDGATAFPYAVTVVDANGTLAYASGLRTGKATFTPPAPGTYRAYAYAEPGLGAPFSPLARAFTFVVGEGQSVTSAKFPIEDAPLAPTSAAEGVLALYAVPVVDAGAEGVADAAGATATLVDAEGNPADGKAPGTYWLRVAAANPGPAKEVPVAYALEYATPITLEGPALLDRASQPAPTLGVPGLAAGIVLVVAGLVAVAAAFRRSP